MRSPVECLELAAEAERRAETVSDSNNKDILLRTAEQWRKLAREAVLLAERSAQLAARTATNVEISTQLSAELKANVARGKELRQEREILCSKLADLHRLMWDSSDAAVLKAIREDIERIQDLINEASDG
jgi:hypothetical protein